MWIIHNRSVCIAFYMDSLACLFQLIREREECKKNIGQTYSDLRRNAFKLYFRDKWNYFEVTTIFCFTVGVVLNYIDYYAPREVARVLLAVSFLSFCMRLLRTFSALELLGPKVLMIAAMVSGFFMFHKLFVFKRRGLFINLACRINVCRISNYFY